MLLNGFQCYCGKHLYHNGNGLCCVNAAFLFVCLLFSVNTKAASICVSMTSSPVCLSAVQIKTTFVHILKSMLSCVMTVKGFFSPASLYFCSSSLYLSTRVSYVSVCCCLGVYAVVEFCVSCEMSFNNVCL